MSHPSQDIYEAETALKHAQELIRRAHNSTMRHFSDGPAHPSIALMELSVRAVGQANDAARYARQALSAAMPGAKP